MTLRLVPREPEPTGVLERSFTAWATGPRALAESTAMAYYRIATRADRWLVERGGMNVLWCSQRDLERWLFLTTRSRTARNRATDALQAFCGFIAQDEELSSGRSLVGGLERNPASGLARVGG